jgi:hypothetical protein
MQRHRDGGGPVSHVKLDGTLAGESFALTIVVSKRDAR